LPWIEQRRILVETAIEDVEDDGWRDESEQLAPPAGLFGKIERAPVEVGPEAKIAQLGCRGVSCLLDHMFA
jgi:hypothetical protein